jgi:hypothetical protein
MVHATSILFASVLVLTATARPMPGVECNGNSTAPAAITADQLIKIDPKTASCADAPAAGECADATAAAAAISVSFAQYGIKTPGEQAALIAIMDFETGGFKYNKNHFPGRPGQGTRNMQMEPFNQKYAADVMPAAATLAGDALTTALNADANISFGSAAWYLTKGANNGSGCTQAIRDGLAAGTKVGWDAYLTTCVGTTAAAERDVPWAAAKTVLGVTGV